MLSTFLDNFRCVVLSRNEDLGSAGDVIAIAIPTYEGDRIDIIVKNRSLFLNAASSVYSCDG